MKVKKRFRGLCLLLAMVLLAVTCACGSKKPDNSDDGEDKENPENVSTSGYEDDESEPYEIIWYYVGNTNNADQEKVEEKINEYLKEKINATIQMNPLEWTQIEGDMMDNIMASGEKYDLRWIRGDAYQTAATKGALLDVDELMKEYAPNTRALLGETFIEGAKIDGKLYGVQANKDNAKWIAIYYRKDIAEKYDMDLSNVKSIEDMYPFFDIILEKEPDMYPYGMGDGKNPWASSEADLIGGNGLVGLTPISSEIVNLYETDLFLECAQKARELYEKGYVYSEAALNDQSAVEFRNAGRVFAIPSTDRPGQLEEINSAGSWGPGEWDKIILSDTAIGDTSYATPSLMAIPVVCENPVRVMKFLELLNTDEYLKNLVDFGIEGEHYTKISDNRIELIPDSGYDLQGKQYIMGNIMIDYLQPGESDTKYEEITEFNRTAEYTESFGFLPDFSSVKIQYSACQNVKDEFFNNIVFGAVEPEEAIKQFNDKLKQAGIDEVVEEVQNQYDAWKATRE